MKRKILITFIFSITLFFAIPISLIPEDKVFEGKITPINNRD